MAKKYYWLKFKDDFFEEEDTKLIEAMPCGKDYIIFLLKLQLKSIRTEGLLKYKGIIPYSIDMLSTITNTDSKIVKQAIDLFSDLKLLEIWEDGTIYMNSIQQLIGTETESASRVRKHREMKLLQSNAQLLQCNEQVTKSNTEIDIEIESTLSDKHKIEHTKVEEMFEILWTIYPKKEGKGRISKAKKAELFKIGIEEMTRAVERYKKAKRGKEKEYLQMGSTFFNSGYIDYLDKEYENMKPVEEDRYRSI